MLTLLKPKYFLLLFLIQLINIKLLLQGHNLPFVIDIFHKYTHTHTHTHVHITGENCYEVP